MKASLQYTVTLCVLAVCFLILSPSVNAKQRFCHPRRSMWSRLTERETILDFEDLPTADAAILERLGAKNNAPEKTDASAVEAHAKPWRPNCGTKNVVCADVFNGVHRYGGTEPFRVDSIDGGSRLLYWYSQSEVGLVGDGGSAEWYPAHGCQKVCVKGNMAAVFKASGVLLTGKLHSPGESMCVFPKDLQEDLTFYLQQPFK